MTAAKLILCIEDEPDIGGLLERTLERLPVEVALVSNGLTALETMAERLPDLIVLDLMLPQMSGWDFLERVRENEDWQGLPVVVLTVRSGREDRKKGEELGIAEYITKPFMPRHLQEVVTTLLEIGG